MQKKCVISVVIFLAFILLCLTDTMAVEKCGVTVYDGAGYTGVNITFHAEDSPISFYKNDLVTYIPWEGRSRAINWSDRISSLKIWGNATVVLYEHGYEGNTGKQLTVKSDIFDLREHSPNMNNIVTSLRLICPQVSVVPESLLYFGDLYNSDRDGALDYNKSNAQALQIRLADGYKLDWEIKNPPGYAHISATSGSITDSVDIEVWLEPTTSVDELFIDDTITIETNSEDKTINLRATVYDVPAISPVEPATGSNGKVNMGVSETLTFRVDSGQPLFPGASIREYQWQEVKSGAPVASRWESSGSDPVKDFRFTTAGERIVYARMVDSNGVATNPLEIPVKVWDLPVVDSQPPGENLVNWFMDTYVGVVNQLVRLQANVSSDNLNGNESIEHFLWDFDNDGTFGEEGEVQIPGQIILYTWQTRNRSEVKCKAITNHGIKSEEKAFGLAIYDKLQADASGNYIARPSESIQLSGDINHSSYTDISTEYQWYVNSVVPQGTLMGSATPMVGSPKPCIGFGDNGQLEYTDLPLGDSWRVSGEFKAGGGGSGASYIYVWAGNTPDGEDSDAAYYSINYDEYDDQIQLNSAGERLATVDQPYIDDTRWHRFLVIFQDGLFRIYLDGKLKLEYDDGIRYGQDKDTVKANNKKFGLGATTEPINIDGNYHSIMNIQWTTGEPVNTGNDGMAEYSWDAVDGTYMVTFSAIVTTSEGMVFHDSDVAKVRIRSGKPTAMPGVSYRGGIHGGNFSPVQFEGNPPGFVEAEDIGLIKDWEWYFGDPVPNQPGIVGKFYEYPPAVEDEPLDDLELVEIYVEDQNIAPTLVKAFNTIDFPDTDLEFQHSNGEGTGLSQNFFARFIGVLDVQQVGEHIFRVKHNDGFRLRIDGRDIAENIQSHDSVSETTGRANLEIGSHLVELAYFERAANVGLILSWIPPGGSEEVIPASAFDNSGGDSGIWNPTHSYQKAGTYTTSLRVHSQFGKWSQSKTVPVQIIDGTVSGTVRAADLRTPVDGVRITLRSEHVDLGVLKSIADSDSGLFTDVDNIYTFTGTDGSYSFEHIPLGSYLIHALKRNGDLHEFEVNPRITELTLDSPKQLAFDFVDLSVFPVGGLIRRLPYDLDKDNLEVPDDSLLVPDVVVEAKAISANSSVESDPSKSTADATSRNYSLPMFGGKYQFFARHDSRAISLDPAVPSELLYDDTSPNSSAVRIVTITGSTAGIHFIDYTKRILTVAVEDSGGYAISTLPDLDENDPLNGRKIAASATLLGRAEPATNLVQEVLEDGILRTYITYELPPGLYSLKAAEDFEGHGIVFRYPGDPTGELTNQIDVDLTSNDGEATMVVPVCISLEFGPSPRLFSFKHNQDYDQFKAFLTGAEDSDPPGLGLTEEQFCQLGALEGYMFYWPPAPQEHTYVIRATANGRPVEGYNLVVTDNVSKMADEEATEQRISISFLLKTGDNVANLEAELEDAVADDGRLKSQNSDLRDLFFEQTGITLSGEVDVRDAYSSPEQFDVCEDEDNTAPSGPQTTPRRGWTITDPEVAVTYFARIETVEGDDVLYVDDGMYIAVGGLPAMDTSDPPRARTKSISFQATKKGYRPSDIMNDDLYVLGDRSIGTAPQLIAEPNINYLVLHDPPGDNSYAFVDDSMTVKCLIDSMTVNLPDGNSIPVYPKPWMKDENGGIISIGNQNLSEVGPEVFGVAAAKESLLGGYNVLAGVVAGPLGFAYQLVNFGLAAGTMHYEHGPLGPGVPMVQYSIATNRKVETPPSEEVLDETAKLPDLVGPGRGDVYFGQGWTIGLQEAWRLGIRFENDQWVPETKSIMTFERIEDRTNQYIYTSRDIERIIESLDEAELEVADDTKLRNIRRARDEWIDHLRKNPAYLWTEFYVGYDEAELKALAEKISSRTGLEQFRYEMLSISNGYINDARDKDYFEAFKTACSNGKSKYGWEDNWNVPEDGQSDVETFLFNGGASFEYSRIISQDMVTKFMTEASVSSSGYSQGEVEVGPESPNPFGSIPFGWEQKFHMGASLSYNTTQYISRSLESGKLAEQKVGFVLQDDDVGDSIATRVYANPFCGTPLFIQDRGSVTSDPWEPGTNRGIDITMSAIPSRLDLRFGLAFTENDVNRLDDNLFPDSLRTAFRENSIPLPEGSEQPVVEVDEMGSRWFVKVPQVRDIPATGYEIRREFDSYGDEKINVYEALVEQGPFDYHTGAHYKVKVVYTGEHDLESDYTTFNFMLYAPQIDNRDNLTVLFNGQPGTYQLYKIGLTKEAPAANISVSIYPPEVDQKNWYEKEYSTIILAQEVNDAQINSSVTLTPRFADLRAPKTEIATPYDGQRISPAMFGDTDADAFTIKIISYDTDVETIRIESRTKGQNGVWGAWSLLAPQGMTWTDGVDDPPTNLGGDPPRLRYIFNWKGADINALGVGEYQMRASATDRAGNPTEADRELPTAPPVEFVVDSNKPTVLTTSPDYQAKEKERIYRGELSVIFTDDMTPTDFASGNVEVIDILESDPLKKVVSGFLSYSPALRKAIFVPQVPFISNGFYRITVKTQDDAKGVSGIHDLAGNPLDQDFSWTFHTTDTPFEETWSIALSISDGNSRDAGNIAAIAFGAEDGEDEQDARSVPRMGSQIALNFLDRDKNEFDRDTRPADGRLGHHWFFAVDDAQNGATVEIRWLPSLKLIRSTRQYQVIKLTEFDSDGKITNTIPLDPEDIDPDGKPVLAYSYIATSDSGLFRLDVMKTNIVATEFTVGSSGWRFFSAPIIPQRANPFVNLGDDIDPLQMFKYVTSEDTYGIYPLDMGEVMLEAGRGYFTRLTRSVEVDIGGAANNTDVTINLDVAGWHAIGNPFIKEVNVADLKFGESGDTSFANAVGTHIERTLYRWNIDAKGTDAYEQVTNADTLEPWEGYFIKTIVDDVDLTIPAPTDLANAVASLPPSFSPPLAPPAAHIPKSGEFELRFMLTSNFAADMTTSLGTRQKASVDYDRFDQSEPPRLKGTASAYFEHNEWGAKDGLYNSDIKPALGIGKTANWTLVIFTDQPDAKMRILWEDAISGVPEDILMEFREVNGPGPWRDMRSEKSVEISSDTRRTKIRYEIQATRFALEPISSLSVVAGEAEVRLQWNASENNYITDYIIYRNAEMLCELSKNRCSFIDTNVKEEVSYNYQIGVCFRTGVELRSDLFTVRVLPVIKATMLRQNYPNPFNPETWVPYELSKDAAVSVEIYSVAGQLVRRLELGIKKRGRYVSKNDAAYWDGRNKFGEEVASGTYFYVLRAGKDFSATRKLVILK